MSGCTGSSLLCVGFLLFLVVHPASHGNGFSCCREDSRLTDSQTLESSGFRSCGAWAQLPPSIVGTSGPEIKPVSPALAGRFLTPGPPGEYCLAFLFFLYPSYVHLIGCLLFPGSSDGEKAACNARDLSLNPGLGRSPVEGNGNPLQYSCLENSRDRGAWQSTVQGVGQTVGHD